jgi:two-component system response regulator AtoC
MAHFARTGVMTAATNGHLPPEEILFGKTEAMLSVRRKLARLAVTRVPLLIIGEGGTGKEVIANYVHRTSLAAEKPMVKVSCPAIPANLLESELFGYEKGSFTGANSSKPGRVEHANGGTLFLDEIGELEPALQAKLLHLLQDGRFSRIGGEDDLRVEVRVICSTNRALDQEIEAGNFRRDLYYRISVATIALPPLRQRQADIPALAEHFIQQCNAEYKLQAPPLSSYILKLMHEYPWPGNIRELENLIRRYVILGTESAIAAELLDHSRPVVDTEMSIPLDGSAPLKSLTQPVLRELERKIILRVLEATNWNRRRTARVLSISYRALLYKMQQAGLPSKKRPRVELPAPEVSQAVPN